MNQSIGVLHFVSSGRQKLQALELKPSSIKTNIGYCTVLYCTDERIIYSRNKIPVRSIRTYMVHLRSTSTDCLYKYDKIVRTSS
jgi:hypothetical protein